jgi:hypothetical protein
VGETATKSNLVPGGTHLIMFMLSVIVLVQLTS